MKVYFTIDKDGITERLWQGSKVPQTGVHGLDIWWTGTTNSIVLPTGFIEKFIGRKLTWEESPYEINEDMLIVKTTSKT